MTVEPQGPRVESSAVYPYRAPPGGPRAIPPRTDELARPSPPTHDRCRTSSVRSLGRDRRNPPQRTGPRGRHTGQPDDSDHRHQRRRHACRFGRCRGRPNPVPIEHPDDGYGGLDCVGRRHQWEPGHWCHLDGQPNRGGGDPGPRRGPGWTAWNEIHANPTEGPDGTGRRISEDQDGEGSGDDTSGGPGLVRRRRRSCRTEGRCPAPSPT